MNAKQNTPICLIRWIGKASAKTSKILVGRFGHQADIAFTEITTAREFLDALAAWYKKSTNTQYLIAVAHGIHDEASDKWIGIGSDGGTGHYISWADLWATVTVLKRKPPALILIGCKTNQAAEFLTPLLTRRWNNPYLVVLADVVDMKDKRQLRETLRLIGQLLHNATSMKLVFIDRELSTLRRHSRKVKIYYPVKLNGQKPKYVDIDDFRRQCGMSFREYLEHVNDRMAKRQRP